MARFPKLAHKNAAKRPGRHVSRHMKDLIHSKWPLLSNAEVDSFGLEHQKFSDAVKLTYGISQEEIDRQLNLLERSSYYAA